MKSVDVIIIGAGAAGLMCAIEAGKRGRSVRVFDHANKAGKKILMSGGGRCNFTNYEIQFDRYISHNPHFYKSALSSYTQWDFIELVKKHGIAFHEKTAGQLFCDNKAKEIVEMLLAECQNAGATVQLNTSITQITKVADKHFKIFTNQAEYQCESLVIASGGLSIPTMGASPFGYKVAEQFNLKVWPTRAGLVPLTLHDADKQTLSQLSGVAIASHVSSSRKSFSENTLFTHRGLSGPAILQISSYWQPGENIVIDMLPECDIIEAFKEAKSNFSKQQLKSFLHQFLPQSVLESLLDEKLLTLSIQDVANKSFAKLCESLTSWCIKPNGTEGYRTAEVTLGGVDVDELSSKTMEVKSVPGLFFVGEVLDVTGWLGGYNFQWAWSSGWAAGQVV